MKSFTEFLNERFINAIDIQTKERYKDDVYALLLSAYASIGGLKGSGFKSADDMVKNIPFWKIARKNGRIVAVAMYKDRGGRKRVAVGTDGSEDGKTALADIYKNEFDRAFFEVSGRSLSVIVRTVGIDFVKKYAKTLDQVRTISKGEEIEPATEGYEYDRFPELRPYFYTREIGGHKHLKIMLGTHGKTIITEEFE